MKNAIAILLIALIAALTTSAQTFRTYPVNFNEPTIVDVPAGSELYAFRPFTFEGRPFPGVVFTVTDSTTTEAVVVWHGEKDIKAPRSIGGKDRRRVECLYVSYFLNPGDLSIVFAGIGCGYEYR